MSLSPYDALVLAARQMMTRSALLAFVVAACGPTVSTTPSWTLAWRDEFEGPAGGLVDAGKWVADTGGSGWGNQERQSYTTRAENVSLDGDGHLVITARAEPPPSSLQCWYGSCLYTSARLKTKDRFARAYGRFEARIRIPRGQGLWPAFWMLGDDIDTVGWPNCGEVDVMENIGREPGVVHGTMHGPGYSGAGGIGRADTLSAGAFADDFHVFAVEWQPEEIRWFVDGWPYHRTTPADLPPGARWAFDHPFFLLVNVAVGGAWPGDPDARTTFPQRMLVDYVRVYRK
jgi:beta-glucanase (GH16 family)